MDSQKMATANFDRLKFEQERYLKLSEDKISQWTKFKEDYLTLRARLETLPHELRYQIMVPVSRVGFMPGRLVNTNEILVLLGDNWFVEKSAKQACELIDRRIANLDKFLDDLNKENKIVRDQLDWTQSLMENLVSKEKNEYVNIEEKLDAESSDIGMAKPGSVKKQLSEEEKRELRRKQQEKASRHQSKIDEYIKSSSSELLKSMEEARTTTTTTSQETIEEESTPPALEGETREEEAMGDEEFDKLVQEYDKTIDRRNNEEMSKKLTKVANEKKERNRRVKWQDKSENIRVVDSDDDDYSQDDDDYYDSDDDYDDTREAPEPIVIKIKHTNTEKLAEIERNLAVSRDRPELNSPGDIYSYFFKPKSILKKTNSSDSGGDTERKQSIKFVNDENLPPSEKANPQLETKFEPHKAFSGEIVERPVIKTAQTSASKTGADSATITTSDEPKKPVSRFKAAKMNQ